MIRKFVLGGETGVVQDSTLGSRQIRVIASTPAPDRAGDVLEPAGCVLDNYLKNPVVLANHDPKSIVGKFAPKILRDRVEGVITFAPEGASDLADETCALAKAGVMSACSVGFKPIESEPIRHTGGLRFIKWELLELSLVAIPCNAEALVVARAMRKSGRVLSASNAAALAAVRECLGRSEDAHAQAVACLDKADRHRAQAMRHAARIAAGAQTDTEDGDVDPDDDPDADVELSYSAHRRPAVDTRPRRYFSDPESERLERERQSRLRAIRVAELSAQ